MCAIFRAIWEISPRTIFSAVLATSTVHATVQCLEYQPYIVYANCKFFSQRWLWHVWERKSPAWFNRCWEVEWGWHNIWTLLQRWWHDFSSGICDSGGCACVDNFTDNVSACDSEISMVGLPACDNFMTMVGVLCNLAHDGLQFPASCAGMEMVIVAVTVTALVCGWWCFSFADEPLELWWWRCQIKERAKRCRDDQQFDSNDNSWFCYFFLICEC